MTTTYDEITPGELLTDLALLILLIIAFIRGKPPKE
ncbi:hypothetical protein ABIB18_002781 [Pantoea sp. UYEF8]